MTGAGPSGSSPLPPAPRRRRRSADLTAASARLGAIPPAYDELLAAAERVGEPFAPKAIKAAMGSDDPFRRSDAAALERTVEKLVNYLGEIADRGLREAGRSGHPSARPEGRSLNRLRDAGVITPRHRDRLVRLVDIRNMIQHDYVRLSPDDLATAVEILQRDLHDLVRALTAWIEEISAGAE